MKRIAIAFAFLIGYASPPQAQVSNNVTVVGSVTPGNCTSFKTSTVIQDAGIACGASASFGNPTGAVGLSALNGTAGTIMRSDSAPPLSSSVQTSLTGTNTGILFGTGAFGFGATAAPVRAGDILYWNGSSWVTLPGNNAGTQYLGETSAGVPSWSVPNAVTPAQFGAVCNNTTDDTTALNNMYAAAGTLGATIQYPNSLCKITNTVNIGQASTSVFPAGGGITSTNGTGVAAFSIQANNVNFVCALGATINGPRTPNTGNDFVDLNYGILINGTSSSGFAFIRISGCSITNFKKSAIWAQFCNQCFFDHNLLQFLSYSGITCVPCVNSVVDSNYINSVSSSNGPSFNTLAPTNTKTNAYGIAITTDGAGHFSQNVVVSNNVVNNVPTWECLDTHAGITVKFVNNIASNCRVGIDVTTDGGTNASSQILVSGNFVSCIALNSPVYPGSANISVGGGGIVTFGAAGGNQANDISIINNSITSCGSSENGTATQAGGIELGYAAFVRMEQNNITAGRWRGIHLTGQVLGLISGNIFNGVVAGPLASGNILIHVDTSSCQCILSRSYGNSSTSEAYFIAAQGGGFQVGISRDNYFPNISAIYDPGGPATNRVDLGASAP